jgi:methylphosphotriester-DNA--protein-cysteine methyltransferase
MLKALLKPLVVLALVFSFSAVFAAEIKCNTKTKTCHFETCRHYNCKDCTKTFQSEQEAVSAGYKFCKRCAKKTQKKSK